MLKLLDGVLLYTAVAVVAVVCSNNAEQQSNEFMDHVLRLIHGEAALYKLEAVPVPDFNITVASNRITNRVFKAKFDNGVIRGLMRVARKGNCEPTRWLHNNITLECTLDLSTLIITYTVVAKGHSLNSRADRMDIHIKVDSGTIAFEAQSLPNKPPHIKTFVIKPPLTLSIKQMPRKSPIVLNEGRTKDFNRQVIEQGQRVVQDAVMGTYLSVVSRVMSKYSDVLILPPVE